MFMSFAFFILSNIVVTINFVKVFFEFGSFLIYVLPEGRFMKHGEKQIDNLLLFSDSWIYLRSHKD